MAVVAAAPDIQMEDSQNIQVLPMGAKIILAVGARREVVHLPEMRPG